MTKPLRGVTLLLLLSMAAWAAPKPPKADKVLSEAKSKAAEQHKAIFLIFGASWCDACHVLDSFWNVRKYGQFSISSLLSPV